MRGVMWCSGDVGLALVTRSGSYTLFESLLIERYGVRMPAYQPGGRWHPVNNVPVCDILDLSCQQVPQNVTFAVVLRDPVDRFRSACARKKISPQVAIETMLDDVHFWTVDSMGLLNHPQARYFDFSQLAQCALFLGLSGALNQVNDEPEKPVLTDSELNWVNQHYAADIVAWNQLRSSLVEKS